jgi:hypothetical protein
MVEAKEAPKKEASKEASKKPKLPRKKVSGEKKADK